MSINVTRQLIAAIKAILRPSYAQVLKWNRNQPRGEKGTHTGGRWVKDVSAGTLSRSEPGPYSQAPGMSRPQGSADYYDILNAPVGTGFKNTPRGKGVRAEAMLARAAQAEETRVAEATSNQNPKVLDALSNSDVQDSERHGGNSNGAFVLTLEDADGNEVKGFYKPERGEAWDLSFMNHDINRFVTNKDFPLAEREVFAYEVDTALKLGLVPATVLRKNVEGVDLGEFGGGSQYDDDELQRMYDSYKERGQDQVYENVAEQMAEKFSEAQIEHADDIENRVQEIRALWDEERKAFDPTDQYGSPSAQREHAELPLGSAPGFQRKDPIDPLAVMDKVGIDPSRGLLSPTQEDEIRAEFRKRLEEGHRELAPYNRTAAYEHLDHDQWMEDHQDTENRLLNEQFPSFSNWKASKGYNVSSGDGNSEAPHPDGGSIQHMRESAEHYGDAPNEDRVKLAVLDYLVGAMDRHHDNVMYENGKIVAIDNGYSMPASEEADSFQFRSDIPRDWSSGTAEVPESLRQTLHDAVHATDWKALVERHPGMNDLEREAFLGRVEHMKEALKTVEGLGQLWDRQKVMGKSRRRSPTPQSSSYHSWGSEPASSRSEEYQSPW